MAGAQRPSVLAFCVNSVANRAQTTKETREYKRLNPTRYNVKSKVNRNIKVQEKEVTKKFESALKEILEKQGQTLSKSQGQKLNSTATSYLHPL